MARSHTTSSPAILARFGAALALAAILPAFGPARAEDAPGLQREVAFDRYPELAKGSALARRLLSPKSYREQQARLAAAGQEVLDLSAERFAVYVPKRKPAAGYALVVFIAPWRDAALPPGWGPVLDEHGAIFVTAARAGNEESVHRRRIPLALVAAWNVMATRQVDPSRVYVAGFSGGSRAAERMALEYPDLFTGAILNAGADPIGEAQTPIPPAALFERFQTRSRLVLVTGDEDGANEAMDAGARSSLRDWCVAHVRQITMRRAGHQVATPEALDEALRALAGADDTRATARSRGCRAELAARLAAEAARVGALRESGAAPETIAAETERLEGRYGWLATDVLAAPR